MTIMIISLIITLWSDIIIMDVIIMTMTKVTLWSSNGRRVPHKGWVVGEQTSRTGLLDCTGRSIKLPA